MPSHFSHNLLRLEASKQRPHVLLPLCLTTSVLVQITAGNSSPLMPAGYRSSYPIPIQSSVYLPEAQSFSPGLREAAVSRPSQINPDLFLVMCTLNNINPILNLHMWSWVALQLNFQLKPLGILIPIPIRPPGCTQMLDNWSKRIPPLIHSSFDSTTFGHLKQPRIRHSKPNFHLTVRISNYTLHPLPWLKYSPHFSQLYRG